MKNIVIVLFFCIPFCGLSQDTLSNWKWGASVGAEQCGRRLKAIGIDQSAEAVWNDMEENVWRLTGGVRIQRELVSGLAVFSGLNYLNRGYRVDTIQDANLNSLNYSFKYLEIPLGLFYSPMNNRKNSILANASINAALSIDNSLQYSKDGQTARFEMDAVPNVNTLSWNVSVGLGIRRAITNTAHADLYLGGNQSLSPLAVGNLERRLFSLGIYLSVMESF